MRPAEIQERLPCLPQRTTQGENAVTHIQNRWAWSLLLAWGLSACGPREDASRRICDGSPGVKAAVQVVGGHLAPDEILRTENGHSFFIIDGTCRYVVKTTSRGEVRTGVLTEAEEEALATKLGYRAWSEFNGDWTENEGWHDGSTLLLWDHQHEASCYVTCRDSAPPELRELSETRTEFLESYWERGTPYVGEAVRLLVVNHSRTQQEPYAWPLAPRPFTDFMRAENLAVEGGMSFEVSGPDADALRTIQSHFLANAPEIERPRPIPIEDTDGNHAGLLLREALPWEDAQGLVRPPLRR